MTTYTQTKPAGTPTWTDLTAPNAEAARNFYQAIFNWNYDVGGPEFGGYATARIGSRTTAGINGDDPRNASMPASWLLYFASDNAEADVRRGTELGAKVIAPAMMVGPMGSMAILEDPTGGTFGFWQGGLHIGSQVTDEAGSMAWAELYTGDAKRASAFYGALLNATVEPMPGGMEYYVLKHGDNMLCGIMKIDPSWGNMPPHWVTYFQVDNADDSVAAITKNGGKVFGPIGDSPFGRQVAVADPAGAQFKLFEPHKG